MKTADQTKISSVEKGAGFVIGSAGIISVFTIFLIVMAVYPATQRDAAQPATGEGQRTGSTKDKKWKSKK